jgi:tRNA modification GTPase
VTDENTGGDDGAPNGGRQSRPVTPVRGRPSLRVSGPRSAIRGLDERGRLPQLADDTIVAVATPAGRGALAVVRLSGADAHQIAGRVVSPWPLPARHTRLCALRHPVTGELIDRGVVTSYDAPDSYTGEHTVEFVTHGGYAVPTALAAALVAAGAREARAGEFTRRAVLNAKMDLLQAEAVGDLVDARSQAMHRSALAQLDGGLSRRVQRLREHLVEIEALLAYDIDFPEEDDGPVPRDRIASACADVLLQLGVLMRTARAGEMVREGAVVVIAGAPNVGKSSLFNALVGRARAIVTDVPGTTRDAIEAVVDAGAWPLRLVDTAGLRATDDVVERIGIEVSERYLKDAHVVLACGDGWAAVNDCVQRVRPLTQAPIVGVRTKADLAMKAPGSDDAPLPSDETHGRSLEHVVAVSAETGWGLRELLDAVGEVLTRRYGGPTTETPLVTRERQLRALDEARSELAAFLQEWGGGDEPGVPTTVAAVHVRAAMTALEELIGTVDVEDVLDKVFSTFCVGK